MKQREAEQLGRCPGKAGCRDDCRWTVLAALAPAQKAFVFVCAKTQGGWTAVRGSSSRTPRNSKVPVIGSASGKLARC